MIPRMEKVRRLGGYQLVECRMDRGNSVEHIALEHVVREFDVEFAFERQHDVDAGMRGHAGLVQVCFWRERLDIAAQAAVFLEDYSDLVQVCNAHVLVALSLVFQIRFSCTSICRQSSPTVANRFANLSARNASLD